MPNLILKKIDLKANGNIGSKLTFGQPIAEIESEKRHFKTCQDSYSNRNWNRFDNIIEKITTVCVNK